ncbi:MAG TPA: type II secretion system F family protein [Nitrososphaerales archaeon]|nr:type II secretion system F family protein [Nitrososphaerales archaeon]
MSRKSVGKKRAVLYSLKYINEKWRYTAYVGSAILAIFSIVVGLLVGGYRLNSHYIVPTGNGTRISSGTPWTLFNEPWVLPRGASASLTDTVVGVGLVLAIIPVVYIAVVNFRYLKSVERNIPRFLRDILEATDSGLILPKALIESAKADYGPISHEIGIAMTKFSLGYDFRASVMEASKKLRHPYAPQVALILAEAYSAGGKMHDVLSSSVKLFNGLEQYNEQKASELKPYTQLVYISVIIFLVIALIIITQFILPLQSLPATASAIPSSIGGASKSFSGLAKIPPMYFESIFFVTALFEAIFGGLVAGKIVDGSAQVGMRHSLILLIITILVFNLPGLGIFNVA